MKLSKQNILIFLGLLFIVLAFILNTSIFEFIGAFFFGIGIALSNNKGTRKRWIIYVIFIVIIAIIFDPILKNTLDSGLKVNTIDNFKGSLAINGSILLIFLISYFITRKLIRK